MIHTIPRHLLLFFACLACIITSCFKSASVQVSTPKNPANPNNSGNLNFYYYTGSPVVGDTLRFHSIVFLSCWKTFKWNFADGTPAGTGSDPYHVYTNEGDYAVELFVDSASVHYDYFKDIIIYKDPLYTSLMTNMRTWHRTVKIDTMSGTKYPYMIGTTTLNLPDTSFAISYINKVTLNYMPGGNFIFQPASSDSNSLVFSSLYAGSIYYNHSTDSISIVTYGYAVGGVGYTSLRITYTDHSP